MDGGSGRVGTSPSWMAGSGVYILTAGPSRQFSTHCTRYKKEASGSSGAHK